MQLINIVRARYEMHILRHIVANYLIDLYVEFYHSSSARYMHPDFQNLNAVIQSMVGDRYVSDTTNFVRYCFMSSMQSVSDDSPGMTFNREDAIEKLIDGKKFQDISHDRLLTTVKKIESIDVEWSKNHAVDKKISKIKRKVSRIRSTRVL